MAYIVESPTGKAYGDMTGKYPKMPSSENQYIWLIYDYDSNLIIGEPLKIPQKIDIMNGYRNLLKQLSCNGYKTQIKTFDNEASDILLEYMRKQNWRTDCATSYVSHKSRRICDSHLKRALQSPARKMWPQVSQASMLLTLSTIQC